MHHSHPLQVCRTKNRSAIFQRNRAMLSRSLPYIPILLTFLDCTNPLKPHVTRARTALELWNLHLSKLWQRSLRSCSNKIKPIHECHSPYCDTRTQPLKCWPRKELSMSVFREMKTMARLRHSLSVCGLIGGGMPHSCLSIWPHRGKRSPLLASDYDAATYRVLAVLKTARRSKGTRNIPIRWVYIHRLFV